MKCFEIAIFTKLENVNTFTMVRLTYILTLILLIFQLNGIYSQTLENDTIFIKKTIHTENSEIDTIIIHGGISPAQPQILIGTTFLPNTEKMIGLINKGLSPISLEIIEECNRTTDPKTFKEYPKYMNVSRDKNILTIDVSVIANCCHNFLGEAEVIGNDTLNLVYNSYGGFCSCECCFTLRFKFDTSMEADHQILKFVTVNGSKKVGQIPIKNK